MEDNDIDKFSWTNLFLVTGFSFLAFSAVLKVLDGSHILLFFRVGLVAASIGTLLFLNKWVNQKIAG